MASEAKFQPPFNFVRCTTLKARSRETARPPEIRTYERISQHNLSCAALYNRSLCSKNSSNYMWSSKASEPRFPIYNGNHVRSGSYPWACLVHDLQRTQSWDAALNAAVISMHSRLVLTCVHQREFCSTRCRAIWSCISKTRSASGSTESAKLQCQGSSRSDSEDMHLQTQQWRAYDIFLFLVLFSSAPQVWLVFREQHLLQAQDHTEGKLH